MPNNEWLLTFLVNAAWQIAAIAGAASIGEYFVRNSPAAHRHALWVLALAASMVVPFAGAIGGTDRGPAVWLGSPEIPPPAMVSASASATRVPNITGQPASAPAPVPFSDIAARAIIVVYLLSAVSALVRFAIAWARVGRMRAQGKPRDMTPVMARVWRSCVESFAPGTVQLLSSATLTTPVALGAVRPAIIVPDGFWSEASQDVLTAALGHEMAHVARRDYAANLLYELLFVPIAFHPASWLIRRRIEQTREMACDEAVTHTLLDAKTYARSILRIATAAAPQPGTACALGIFDGNKLEERIRQVLAGSNQSVGRARLLLATAVSGVAAAALIASGLALTATAQSASEERLKEGIAAYNADDVRTAVGKFTAAVSADPSNIKAKLFLANALMREFYQQGTQGDGRLMTAARQQYHDVVAREPKNKQALAGLSAIALDDKQLVEARSWAEKLASVDPDEKTAWYAKGMLDWAIAYPDFQKARQAAGVPVEAPFIPDANVRRALRDQHLVRINEGIRSLQKAIALDPTYHEAMAYLNLLHRLQAAVADDAAQSVALHAEADRWVAKAVQIKRQQGGTTAIVSRLAADGSAPGPASRHGLAQPPPPPPPPPAPPGGSASAGRPQPVASAAAMPAMERNQLPTDGKYWHVAGSTELPARELYRLLRSKGFDSRIHAGSDGNARLLAGPYFDATAFEKAKGALQAAGFRVLGSWN